MHDKWQHTQFPTCAGTHSSSLHIRRYGTHTLVSQHQAPLSRGSHTVHDTRFYIQGRWESIHAGLHLSGLFDCWWPASSATMIMMKEWEASSQICSGRNVQICSGTYVQRKRIKNEFRERELTITLRNYNNPWLLHTCSCIANTSVII